MSSRWRRLAFLLVFSASLLASASSSFAGAGFFKQFVIINRGSGNEYFGNPPGSGFNGQNLTSGRTWYAGDTAPVLNGAEANTFQYGGDTVSNVRFFYKINSTAGSGSFTEVGLAQRSASGNDRMWDQTAQNIALAARTAGTYGIEVYFQAQGNWSGGNWQFYDSASPDYRATFTITALSNPSGIGATADSSSQITVNWTAWNSKPVLIVRHTANSFTAPTQGQNYNVNGTIGSGTVVYKGNAGSFVNSSGLSAGTQYFYRIYSNNNNYYSDGVTVNATTQAAATPTLNPVTLASALSATYPSVSSGVGFTASGSALSTTITATAQSGYEVSTSSGSGYTSSVSVSSGATVYVRFAAKRAAATYNSATAVVLSSTGAANQNVTTSSSGNTVSQKALTISGASATNRAYNASTTVAVSGGSLVGVESGDTVTLSAASASGTVATATVDDGKAVTVTGYSISGASSGNYSLTQPTGLTVNITKANPTIAANPTASGIKYGRPLSASTFSGGTTTPAAGTWTWNSPSTIPAPGTASYPATFTPTDTTNYNNGTASVSVTVEMAQARNTGGAASPTQPAALYLGDTNQTFGADTWGTIDGAFGNPRLFIRYNNSDVSGGNTKGYAGFTNVDTKTLTSGQFTNTGTWYWGIQMDYGADYGTNFWYKAGTNDWTDMSTNGVGSTLAVTVNELPTPTINTFSGVNTNQVTLNWAKATNASATTGYDVLVLRSTNSSFTDPTQGQRYDAGTNIGSATVIYRGSTNTLVDSNLTAGTTYYYKLYSENWNYYSAGVTTNIATAGTPTITIGGTPLAAVNTTYGTESATPTSFTVSGANLTGNLTVTPPAGFEVSTGGAYSTSVTLTSSNGTVASTTIQVRLAATTVPGNYSGNVVVSGGGATTQNVATVQSSVAVKPLTVTGISGANKVFDGTTTASVTGTAALSGLVGSDSVTLVTGTAAFAFADANVGTGKAITASGYSLTGPQAGRYSITQPTGLTGNITAASLPAVTFTAPASLEYNRTAKTYTASASGVTLTLTYTGRNSTSYNSTTAPTNVGDYTVTASTSNTNYTGSQAQNFSITAKGITGSFTASNKEYDGNANATVTGRSLAGVETGDTVTLTGGTATFNNANVGTNKTVTLAGATLDGAAAGNYSLTSVSTTTANITAKALTGSFTVSDKVYDGTTAATVATRAVSGKIGSDDVNHTGGTATFSDANAGNGKTVTLASASLTGAAASNYTLSSVSTTTANITKATPTITAAPSASAINEGQALSASTLTGGTATGVGGGALGGEFTFTSPGTTPAVGTANQSVTFTPNDATNYNTATTSVSVTVNSATQPLPENATLVDNLDGSFTLKIDDQAVEGVSYSYVGRTNGVTGLNTNTFFFLSYSNTNAPVAPGFYRVTATASGAYTGSRTNEYAVAGPLGRPIDLTKIAGVTSVRLNRSTLLGPLQMVTTNGVVTNGPTGLSWTATTAGSSTMPAGYNPLSANNTVTNSSSFVTLTPANAASITDTFTLTVSDGVTPVNFPVTIAQTNAPEFDLVIRKLLPIEGDTNNMKAIFVTRPNRSITMSFAPPNAPSDWKDLTSTNEVISTETQPTAMLHDGQTVQRPPASIPTGSSGVLEFKVPKSAGTMFFRAKPVIPTNQ